MAITKKQKEQLENRFKNIWKAYNNLPQDDKLKELYRATITEQEYILGVLGYTRNDFINLKNQVLEVYNINIYCKYIDLHRLAEQITGYEITFLYSIESAENLIDSLDYDVRRYGELKNKLHYIKLEEENNKKITEQLQQQIKSMIA